MSHTVEHYVDPCPVCHLSHKVEFYPVTSGGLIPHQYQGVCYGSRQTLYLDTTHTYTVGEPLRGADQPAVMRWG